MTYPGYTPVPTPKKKRHIGRWVIFAVGSFLALIAILANANPAPASNPAPVSAPAAEAQVQPAPAPAPIESASGFGDGDWVVGDEIAPGKYTTSGADGMFKFATWTIYSDDSKKNILDFGTVGEGKRIIVVPKNAKIVSFSGNATWVPAQSK